MKKMRTWKLNRYLLGFILLFLLLPVTAVKTSAANSGECGYNCRWTVSGSVITFIYKTAYLDTSKNITGAISISDLSGLERSAITEAVFDMAIAGIGEGTLDGFKNLKKVTVKSTVCKTIADKVFYDLEKLETADLGKSLVSIGEESFRLCTSLRSITLPATVKTIGRGAFWSSGLEEISLPGSLENLGENAFQVCRKLKAIEIPGKIKSIPKQCFYGADMLETAVISNGVEQIAVSAFQGCSNLKTISIPATVAMVGNAAFESCTKLEKLDLSHVSSIGHLAVSKCLGLSEIRLSNSLKTVDSLAFYNNFTDKKVIFDGTQEEFAKIASKSESRNTDLLTGMVQCLQSSSDLPKTEDVEKVILPLSGKAEVPGSTFHILRARASKTRKKSIQLKWKAVPGASGYIIYGAERKAVLQKLETIKNGGTTSYTHTGLKLNRYYRYIVTAYQNVGSGTEDLRVLSCSKVIFAATLGGNYRNTQAVKVPSRKITLKRGKKQKLNASLSSKAGAGKKYRTFLKIRYESSDPAVATVNRNGRVKAVSKGTCYIFAYAQDGIFSRVKVTVK